MRQQQWYANELQNENNRQERQCKHMYYQIILNLSRQDSNPCEQKKSFGSALKERHTPHTITRTLKIAFSDNDEGFSFSSYSTLFHDAVDWIGDLVIKYLKNNLSMPNICDWMCEIIAKITTQCVLLRYNSISSQKLTIDANLYVTHTQFSLFIRVFFYFLICNGDQCSCKIVDLIVTLKFKLASTFYCHCRYDSIKMYIMVI